VKVRQIANASWKSRTPHLINNT